MGRTKKDTGQTPLMRQYYKIKERHPNAILLFRMGDFYETFDEDAHTVSRVLGITLTKRANGQAADVPLAGFPHHALDNYLPKLVRAGYRVAICEQLEDPKYARKVVKRDVVEVVTPGVAFHDQLVNPRQAHYLAAVHFGRERGREDIVGFAFIDATTGEFSVTEAEAVHLESLLETIGPAEVLVEKGLQKRLQGVRGASFVLTPLEDWVFGFDFAYETLLRHFKTHSLKGFGVDDLRTGLVAAGAALHYLGETQKGRLPHIRRITRYAGDDYMALDRRRSATSNSWHPCRAKGVRARSSTSSTRRSRPWGRACCANGSCARSAASSRSSGASMPWRRCSKHPGCGKTCGRNCARWATSSGWQRKSVRAVPPRATSTC
ncbi:MAG: hypothetical protein KatS3mg044_1527 [Rhodothermaceae bacterium]|nr:MAG: hypothetical protein KatS3mg044_1527 [Rhodothermaceae bacterium]